MYQLAMGGCDWWTGCVSGNGDDASGHTHVVGSIVFGRDVQRLVVLRIPPPVQITAKNTVSIAASHRAPHRTSATK